MEKQRIELQRLKNSTHKLVIKRENDKVKRR